MTKTEITAVETKMVTKVIQGVKKIKSSAVTRNLRKRLLKAEGGYSFYNINLSEPEIPLTVVRGAENVLYRFGVYNVEPVILTTDGRSIRKITKRFTKDVVSISFNSDDYINSVIHFGIYVDYTELPHKVYVGKSETTVILLGSKGIEDIITIDEMTKDATNVVHYFGAEASPSMLRSSQAYSASTELDNDERLDKITYGGWSKIKGAKVEGKKAVKYTARTSQGQSPSCAFGTVRTLGYVIDNFKAMSFDGVAFMLDEFIAEKVTEKIGVPFAPIAVRGFELQLRPWTVKAAGPVISKGMMTELMLQREVVRFIRGEITDEQQKQIDLGKDGIYAGKCIIIGEDKTSAPDVLVDTNSVKMVFDYNRSSDLNVLDIGQASGANLSKQMLEKAFNVDAKATQDAIFNIYETNFNKEIGDLFVEQKTKIPSIKEIDNLYLNNIIASIAPNYAIAKNFSLYKTLLGTETKRMDKNINKLKLAVEGNNGRLFPDMSKMFGFRLIKDDELFFKKAYSYFKATDNTDMKVSVFKYPTMGSKEYFAAKLVSMTTLRKRIKAAYGQGKINKNQMELLIDFYATLDEAVIVVPAIEILKQMLAGMDFDYDGASVIYDVKLNEILHREGLGFHAIDIVNDNIDYINSAKEVAFTTIEASSL